MDTSQIEGGIADGKQWVAVARFQLRLKGQQFTQYFLQGVHGIVAQRRVAGVSRAALNHQLFHHDALVHGDRLEAGGFADHRATGLGFCRSRQGLGAGHGGFLVGGSEHNQRLL